MHKHQDNPTTTDRSALGPPLITTRTAAKRLGISTRRVRRLVAEQRIAHYDICGKIRFSPEAIQLWLDDNSPHTDGHSSRDRS